MAHVSIAVWVMEALQVAYQTLTTIPTSPKGTKSHSRSRCCSGGSHGTLQPLLDNSRSRGGGDGTLQTLVENRTAFTLVLRNKYKDVWEDVRFTLAPGQSLLVSWTPAQPYLRLGVLLQHCQHPPVLLIGSSTIAQFHHILLSSSSLKNTTVHTLMLARPPPSSSSSSSTSIF